MEKKLLLVLSVVALLLVACGKKEETPASTPIPTAPQQTAPEAEDERTTILFAVEDVLQPLYEGLIESFEEDNPDIHVQLVSINEILEIDLLGGDVPDDASQRLAANADVINMQASRDAVQQGLVYDLTPLIQADPNFQRDDFYPGALERNQWDGGTWSLPTRVMFNMIYYDKDAFDEAGLSYPELGWSWDDFVAAAEALTVRDGDQVTRWGFVQPTFYHLSFIEGRVGRLIDETSDPPTPRLDQPEVIDAVRWYVDLYLKEEVMPFFEPPGEGEQALASEGQVLVENGAAAMWHEWSAVWDFRKEQGNRGIVPYPVDVPDSQTSLMVWAGGTSMSAGTAHPNAAWRWMDFLSRQDISQQGPLVRFLPARRSVAESSGFWDEVDEELADALRYAIEHSYVAPTTPGYDAFFEALNMTLSGEKSVDAALMEAQKQTEADIQEARADQAATTPVPTFAVAAREEDAPAAEGLVTIAFNPSLGAMNMQAYRDAAQKFREVHPDIQVELKLPDLTGTSLEMKDVAESADCFQWTPDIQSPEKQALILNLKPLMDADPSFNANDFYPSVLDRFTWQGQTWGLPAGMQPYVIEYNKDLFAAASVDEPALDWTTDDFVELAKALTRGEGEDKQYGFVPYYFEVNDLLLLIEPRGARLIDESADPSAFTLNDPATVEALQWYVALATEHEIKPIFLADIADIVQANTFVIEREALINEGRAAMWTYLGAIAVGGEHDTLNTGVAPLPAGSGGASVAGVATGYFISAHTEARQACWQWILFLTEQPGLAPGFPSRLSVAESDAFRQQVGAERAEVYHASIAGAERASVFDILTGQGWLSGGLYWLGRAYSQAVEGEASVEEALNAAQKMSEDYRACVVVEEAIADQKKWLACMQEVDPTLPAFLFNQGGD